MWFCFSECEVSAQCIISQNFLETCGSFLSIPHRLSDRPKNYPSMTSSSDLIYKEKKQNAKSEVKQVLRLKWNRSNPKSRRISFTFLFGTFWDGWWDDLVNHFVLFCCFFIIKKLKKLFKNYLRCFLQYQTWKIMQLFQTFTGIV